MATYLVTGANRGIGLALCRQLAARGDAVIAVCRKSSPELDALGVRVEAGVDVASDAGPGELARRLGATKLDVLINNAGVLHVEALGQLDLAEIRRQFEVNALAPLRVTDALVGHLKPGAKVGIVTSRMGSIADNGSGGYYGYRMSKAAVNAAAKSLAIDLRPQGVAVCVLHPGFVRTEMTGGNGMIDPETSARGLIARLDALTLETTGTFWHQDGSTLPW